MHVYALASLIAILTHQKTTLTINTLEGYSLALEVFRAAFVLQYYHPPRTFHNLVKQKINYLQVHILKNNNLHKNVL